MTTIPQGATFRDCEVQAHAALWQRYFRKEPLTPAQRGTLDACPTCAPRLEHYDLLRSFLDRQGPAERERGGGEAAGARGRRSWLVGGLVALAVAAVAAALLLLLG